MQSDRLDEKLLKRRKAMVTGMVALTVLVLVGFIFGSWQFLQKMGNYLEDELGSRLKAISTLASKVIEAEDFPYEIESDRLSLILPSLNEILTKVHRENELQGVYLIDQNLRILSSSKELFESGTRFSFLDEDSLAINQALAGFPAVASMQLVAGNRFKSAYAPIFGSLNDVVAIVVVQANAGFFDLLRVFQRGLILGGVVSIALALLFSLFLFWAISLLIKTHESLRKSERLAAMGQMSATVAHEIRNPLGIIKGTADVLQSKYDSKEEPDELFEYIPSEVRRLNRLVNDFLAFARDRELQTNAIDLIASVEKSLYSLQSEIQEANVSLQKDYDKLPELTHDEDAINQLVLNLTLNSLQSMNGQGTLTIRLKNTSRSGRSHIKMEIADTGQGFDVDPEKLFEPFYTTKTYGSGLGLAICKRLVEKHDGWMEVDSETGKGTTMRIYLPV